MITVYPKNPPGGPTFWLGYKSQDLVVGGCPISRQKNRKLNLIPSWEGLIIVSGGDVRDWILMVLLKLPVLVLVDNSLL